jgi:hypothetical protein
MPKIEPTYKLRSLLVSAVAVSAVFLTVGPVVSESLIRYGFEIFSSSMGQDLAILAAGTISFPAVAFFDSMPVSRFWMAVNGAFWGIAGYFFLVSAARFLNQRNNEKP